jgi:lipopolysaccharide/colanic/teichoic acid biosynthesis glycosyltransferase
MSRPRSQNASDMTSRSPGIPPSPGPPSITSRCPQVEIRGEESSNGLAGHALAERVHGELNGVGTPGALPDAFPFARSKARPPSGVVARAAHPGARSPMLLCVKRAMDLALGIVALVLTLPLWAAIAAAIRLDTPGPVLFRQERVTKGGAIFTMYKFRTMVHASQPVVAGDALNRTVPFFKSRNDPQVTSVGRILRETSLDELPQLWNVIRGDMSMVGPRPLWLRQLLGQETYSARHKMKAGLTGWWQINGRSHLDRQTALELDLFYIEHWSLRFDLYILLRTVGAVLTRRGAY